MLLKKWVVSLTAGDGQLGQLQTQVWEAASCDTIPKRGSWRPPVWPLWAEPGPWSNSCDTTTPLYTLTFMEIDLMLLGGNKLFSCHLYNFGQVVNCDGRIWIQRNTLLGQSSSTSFGDSKRRSVLTQTQPLQWHHMKVYEMVHSASWNLAMYIYTPFAAEREEEGQEKPLSPCVLQEGPDPTAPRDVG